MATKGNRMELDAALQRVTSVFVWCNFHREDGWYVRASKQAVKEVLPPRKGDDIEYVFHISEDDPNELYIG